MGHRSLAVVICAALFTTACGPGATSRPGTPTRTASPPVTATAAEPHDPVQRCQQALARLGVRAASFTTSQGTSYTVPAGPAAPLQGGFTFAVRNAVSTAVGLPLTRRHGQQLNLIQLQSTKTSAVQATSSAGARRTPRILGYECAVDARGTPVGLWARTDPTIEPDGLMAADGRTLAQVESAPSTFAALVKSTGYDPARDANLPAGGTPLEALLRALGRLNTGAPPGPLVPMHHLAHLVPLGVVVRCAFPDGGVAIGLNLWPDYKKPFRTAALAGNGSEYLEWSLRRDGAWTLAALGTGGACSDRSPTDKAAPLPPSDLVAPYTASIGAGAVAAVNAFYRDWQHGDCRAAYAMTAGQVRHDAGSETAFCAQHYPEGPPVVTGVALPTPDTAVAALRFAHHLVDVNLERTAGTWKITATQIVGATGS